jgi:hypothetical protein
VGIFDTDKVVPGSAIDLLRQSASAGSLAAEAERRAAQKPSAILINLDLHRRARDMPSIEDACLLIEETFDSPLVAPRTRENLEHSLGGILCAIVDGDQQAAAAWRRIERELRTPVRPAEPGEPPFQAMTDWIITIDALALHYWTRHARREAPQGAGT